MFSTAIVTQFTCGGAHRVDTRTSSFPATCALLFCKKKKTKRKKKKKKRHFLNTHLSAIILEGDSTCCLQQQVEPNVVITRKVRGAI